MFITWISNNTLDLFSLFSVLLAPLLSPAMQPISHCWSVSPSVGWSVRPSHFTFVFLSQATRPCRCIGLSVRRSIGSSVPLNFFGLFGLFEGRIARALVSYGCSCPCPNHFCPCPTHYCPCPTARDRGSRVYSLVLLTCCLVNFFHVF